MLPSEATALGMAIQEMEAPAALERMREGRNQYSEPSVPGNGGHESREIAAVTGVDERTIQRDFRAIESRQGETDVSPYTQTMMRVDPVTGVVEDVPARHVTVIRADRVDIVVKERVDYIAAKDHHANIPSLIYMREKIA